MIHDANTAVDTGWPHRYTSKYRVAHLCCSLVTLVFDPAPLPSLFTPLLGLLSPRDAMAPCLALLLQVISSTRIVFTVFTYDTFFFGPSWTPEPGSLKIIAINTGTELVYLDPDGGGVVVQNDVPSCSTEVQENEGLRIYQSTKRVKIAGSCFSDNMKASRAPYSIAGLNMCHQWPSRHAPALSALVALS